jgi:hypothetical protein
LVSAGKSADAVLRLLQGNCLLVVADGWPGGGSQGMGDGGQRESDDRRYPIALTEDYKETANGLPVLDELEDGPLVGSHPSHHGPLEWPESSVWDMTFGVEMGEAVDVEWRLGLADVSDHDLIVWDAAPNHDPAGVEECMDAFGGDMVNVLTGGCRAGDRVEEADDAGLGVCFNGQSPAGSPGEACDEAGAEQ